MCVEFFKAVNFNSQSESFMILLEKMEKATFTLLIRFASVIIYVQLVTVHPPLYLSLENNHFFQYFIRHSQQIIGMLRVGIVGVLDHSLTQVPFVWSRKGPSDNRLRIQTASVICMGQTVKSHPYCSWLFSHKIDSPCCSRGFCGVILKVLFLSLCYICHHSASSWGGFTRA